MPEKSLFVCLHAGLFLCFLVGCSPESANGASLPANGVPVGGTAASNPPNNPNGTLGANPPGSGLIGTAGATSGLPGNNGTMKGETCAKGMGTTSPVTPTVWLIVDGSSSMTQMFAAGQSRWAALRSTLMDSGGVVDSLQASVRFGMVIYAGGDGGTAAGACVQLITVEPALNNLANIAAQYPNVPVASGTPTDKALDHVVTSLPVLNQGTLDMKTGPTYVVLATDGSPNDNCPGGLGGGRNNAAVEQQVIDTTARGTQMGMQMFVVSLAGTDMRLQNHLALVSQATASKTPPYVPSTQADLVAAFRKIVGSAGCQVGLDGMVKPGSECSGTVQLNSIDILCDKPDGWRMFDARTVQLTGKACETYLQNSSIVVAKFPCDAFVPD